MLTFRFLLLALIAGLSLPCWSATGEVDSSFTTNGIYSYNAKVALQSDGRLLLGDTASFSNGVYKSRLVRLFADGSLDSSFTPDSFSGDVLDLLVQPDGKILVAADPIDNQSAKHPRLLRLLANGERDSGFHWLTEGYAVNCLALQPDGEILISSSRNELFRLLPDGTRDVTFAPQVLRDVTCAVVQVDGKILVGGGFFSIGGVSRRYLARLNADGTLDEHFDPLPDGSVTCIALRADGGILVGGLFRNINGLPQSRIACLKSDGTRDLSFQALLSGGVNGFGVPQVNGIAVQADGKVLIGGNLGAVDGVEKQGIARLLSNGRLDGTFTSQSDTAIKQVLLQPDGKPVLVPALYGAQVVRLQSDAATQSLIVTGRTSVKWLRSGSAPEIAEAIFELSQDLGRSYSFLGAGKRVKGGWSLDGLSLPASGQIRASSRSAGGRGLGVYQPVQSVTAFGKQAIPEITVETAPGVRAEDGGLWEFTPANPGTPITRTLSVINSGDLDLKLLAARVIGPDAESFTITSYPASRVQGGGGRATMAIQFTPDSLGRKQATLQLSTSDRSEHIFDLRLVAEVALSNDATLKEVGLDLDSGLLSPVFSPATNTYSVAVPLDAETLVIYPVTSQAAATVKINSRPWSVGERFLLTLVPGRNLITIKVTAQDGITTKTFLLDVSRPEGSAVASQIIFGGAALCIEPDGSLVVGGGFQSLDQNLPAQGILRLRSDGVRDVSFQASVTGGTTPTVQCLSLLPDLRMLVGGSFTTVNGQPRANLARLHRDGTLDLSFDPGANGPVSSCVQMANGRVIVLGTFTQVAGAARSGLAMLSSDGMLDVAFAPLIEGGAVLSAVTQADGGIIIAGSFTSVNGTGCQRLARLHSDGSLDLSFVGAANDTVNCVSLQANGALIIGGRFSTVGVAARRSLARLRADGSADLGFDAGLTGGYPSTYVAQILVQADGRLLVSGGFSAVRGEWASDLARLNTNGTLDASFGSDASSKSSTLLLQDDGYAAGLGTTRLSRIVTGAPVENLQVQPHRIDWQRGGSLPEALEVLFELSTDHGATHVLLGKGNRVAGGWELAGISLPEQGHILARARIVGGRGECSGIVESVAVFGQTAAPEIAVMQGTASVANGSAVDLGAAYAQEPNLLPLRIMNTGEATLRLADFTITGADAAKFSIANFPLYETPGPSGDSVLVVQVESDNPGPLTATLHIESNDADEAVYDIPLTANLQTSRNADLSSLSVGASLRSTPSFYPQITSYQHTVDPSANTVQVRPTAGKAVSAITVNGLPVASGGLSAALPVSIGVNATTITVVVTALDGVTTKTYTAQLTRHYGGLVQPFQFDPDTLFGGLYCSAELPGRQVLAGGDFQYDRGSRYFIDLVSFHPDGGLDDYFVDARGDANCLATWPDGRWLVGGLINLYSSETAGYLANLVRFDSINGADAGYLPGIGTTVRCLAVQEDGKMLDRVVTRLA